MNFIEKYLPIIFGCHGRPDRSFYYNSKKFPICARCTGELIGIFLGIILFKFIELSLLLNFLFLIPLVVDGLIQLLTSYESNNTKRFLTGTLFGYGLVNLFIKSAIFTVALGQNFGRTHKI